MLLFDQFLDMMAPLAHELGSCVDFNRESSQESLPFLSFFEYLNVKSTAVEDVSGCCVVHRISTSVMMIVSVGRRVMRGHLVSYCFLHYMLVAAQCSLLNMRLESLILRHGK